MTLQILPMKLSVLILQSDIQKANTSVQYLTRQFPEMQFFTATIEKGIEFLKKNDIQLLIIPTKLLKTKGAQIWNHFPNPQFDVLCAGENIQQTSFALHFLTKSSEKKVRPASPEDNPKPILDNTIALPNSSGYDYINIFQILYCKAARNYSEIILLNGKKITISKNIKFLAAVLKDYPFLRVSKSYLINLKEVQSYSRKDGGFVQLSNETIVPVSKLHKEALLESLNGNVKLQ